MRGCDGGTGGSHGAGGEREVVERTGCCRGEAVNSGIFLRAIKGRLM